MSFPLQSHTSLKMLNFCKLLIFIFLVSAVSLSSSSNAGSECSQAECLKVPASSFISSLKTTVDAIQQVVPVISKFANLFDDFRLTNAISDYLDLLDFSADELSWSISASQNPAGNPLIYLLVWFGMLLGMWLELECYWKMVGCWVWVGVLLSVCIGVLEYGCWSIPTRRGHYCWKSSLKSCCWNVSINLWKFCWVTWLGFWGYNLTVLFYIWDFFLI
ncbi:uncharacterized protein LOC18053206 isoform X1 [Citrus clementina]|nr:uncharacterized protein LOC18053206 isoform X1 [Citrus x clementina]XP_024047633.1 uncharacterized protein LOC18053206 isoform X1 [Citrus x clementina]